MWEVREYWGVFMQLQYTIAYQLQGFLYCKGEQCLDFGGCLGGLGKTKCSGFHQGEKNVYMQVQRATDLLAMNVPI